MPKVIISNVSTHVQIVSVYNVIVYYVIVYYVISRTLVSYTSVSSYISGAINSGVPCGGEAQDRRK